MAPSMMTLLTAASALVLSTLMPTACAGGDIPGTVAIGFQRNHAKHALHALNLSKRDTIEANLNLVILQGGFYYVNLTVGTPGKLVQLDIDTGSSDVWMFGPNSCDPSTSPCLGGFYDPADSTTYELVAEDSFQIRYVTANSGVQGNYIADNFQIGGATVQNLTMGLATSARYVATGIMGIGFDVDESSASNLGVVYPNLVDVMFNDGQIPTRSYSLYLDDLEAATGTVLFGGYDTDKFLGDLAVLDIQPDAIRNTYSTMSVIWSSIGVTDSSGSTVISPSSDSSSLPVVGILDSGTALTVVPDDIFANLAQYFGVMSNSELGYLVSCDLGLTADTNGTLNFGFGGQGGPVIAVPFSEMAIALTDPLTGQFITDDQGNKICRFGLESLSQIGGEGRPILIGDTFLRSAYVVYDLDALQIGLAQTRFDATGSNVVEVTASQSQVLAGASSVVGQGSTLAQSATRISVGPGAAGSGEASVSGVSIPLTMEPRTTTTQLGGLRGDRTTYAPAAPPTSTSAGATGSPNEQSGADASAGRFFISVVAVFACGILAIIAL